MENKYVYWLITGAVGLMGTMISFLVKRGMDKQDKRIEKTEREVKEIDDRLSKAVSELPFLYTLREDFIRSTANHDRKLDQIITLLTQGKGGNGHG